ncbi:hypothetical protein STCU_09396 [Strigomonas culicis]|uniref:Abnormal spindle-like microcephaly-associated protein ASH domain-containing protein n=1 Tax=Strigomonas culicis TaxID=28005 RepID=S9TSK6_9TRYP|nr:hypothetical protein STCU_09396 [Strigomonas culicis]|eukprot:EPY19544.1 hypothetical protein STCU_09396 [Strigomonas culicis]
MFLLHAARGLRVHRAGRVQDGGQRGGHRGRAAVGHRKVPLPVLRERRGRADGAARDRGRGEHHHRHRQEGARGAAGEPHNLSGGLPGGAGRQHAHQRRRRGQPVPVDARVHVLCDDEGAGTFSIAPMGAVDIPRGGRQTFRVTFRARDAGTLQRHTYECQAQAGNILSLELRGQVLGPRVKASTSYLDYGDVNLDKLPSEKERTKVVQLKNASEGPAYFQFLYTAPGAAFTVTPHQGIIPARGSVVVRVVFQPRVAMNYLRRLCILVRDTTDALYVDAFGSAYNHESRPLAFKLPQVDAFYLRQARGMAHRTPDELEQIATSVIRDLPPEDENDLFAQNAWRSIEVDTNSAGVLERGASTWMKRRRGRCGLEALVPPPPSTQPFTVESRTLVFGAAHPQTQTVSVLNNTPATATATWCVPANSPFTIAPESLDVQPGEAAIFSVSMRGQAAAVDTTQYLECYMGYTQMRSFRLVNELSFLPPHCFTVLCSVDRSPGAPAGPTEASALVAVESPRMMLPTAYVEQSTYRVFSLENKSNAEFLYDAKNINISKVSEKAADEVLVRCTRYDGAVDVLHISEDGGAGEKSSAVFSCYPPSGVLGPQGRALLLVRFEPTYHARYEGEAAFVLNGNAKDVVRTPLVAEANVPQLHWEGCTDQTIVFCPTCVTGETKRHLHLRNPTGIALSYEFEWSSSLLGVVRVEPAGGLVGPYERQPVTVYFGPEQAHTYAGTLSVVMRALDSDDASFSWDPIAPSADEVVAKEYVLSTEVRGEGMHAVVEMEPNELDCHDTEWGASHTATLNLYNSGLCDVQYQVRTFRQREPEGWQQVLQPPQLQNHTGVLPARSHTTVLATVVPSGGVSEYIFYVLVSGLGSDIAAVVDARTREEVVLHPHCVARIQGARPGLQIADARSLTKQRSQLWEQLSINRINEQLSAPVLPTDMDESAFEFPQYIDGLTPIPVELGVGHLQSSTAVATVQLANTGTCAASFRVVLPGESEVPVETWYMEDDSLREVQFVRDKGLIDISPRSGSVEVGGTAMLTFSYRFDALGAHTLPALLRVDEGKKALLMLQGRTVAAHRPAVEVPRGVALMPVALGDLEPPLQAVALCNPTTRAVQYKVDDAALRRIADRHYGFPVLQCINPVGVLEPRASLQLGWYFRPLEARAHALDVPLYVRLEGEDEGEALLLSFVGRGFHPRHVTADQERTMAAEAFLALPVTPSLRLPALPVALSMDVCRLGTVPFFSLHRRLCTVTNHHPSDTYAFQWDVAHQHGNHVLGVTPAQGALPPGASATCLLVLYSGSTCQRLEHGVTCVVTNESTISREATAAEHPADGQEADIDICDPPRKAPVHRLTPVHEPIGDVPSRYQTARTLEKKMAMERRQIEAGRTPGTAVVWNALELLLQAHVVPVEAYERLYGRHDLHQHHFPVSSVVGDHAARERALAVETMGYVQDTVNELLRAVVAQPKVQLAFRQPCVPPVVTYKELVAKAKEAALREAAARPTAKDNTTTSMLNILEEALSDVLLQTATATATTAASSTL